MFENTTKGVGLNLKCVISLICALIANYSIVSQTITDTREITYDRLNEFAKLVEHRKQSDSLLVQFGIESAFKDSLLINRDNVILQYKNEVVPALEARIRIKDSIIGTNRQIFGLKEEVYEAEIKTQKSKKWTWLGGGALLGLILGVVFGG